MSTAGSDSASRIAPKRWWVVVKWCTFFVVLFFVAFHGYKLWRDFEAPPVTLQWSWLALAAATSIAAWLPSLWYWRRLMALMATCVAWPQAARAYYCGHLGKYVPGKGAALVIRSALLQDAGVSPATAALTVALEALTCMWAGALTALLLYPALAPHLPAWVTVMFGPVLLRGGLLAAAAGSGLFVLTMLVRSHRLLLDFFHRPAPSVRISRARPSVSPAEPPVAAADGSRGGDASAGQTPSTSTRAALRVVLSGGLLFLAAWWIQGLTLGLTIRAVSADRGRWEDWPFWTGTSAVAMVGGFAAVFAPGGLGVREGLVMEILKEHLGPREAVLTALLWRGASLAGEILAAAALYYGVASAASSVTPDDRSDSR